MTTKKIIVTGIGTDVGKTIISAILTEKLNADYWKPVQAGLPKDSDTVKSLISNQKSQIIPETYCLNTPASPHYAAEIDNIHIKLPNLNLPATNNHLIIEGAGGVMVPLNCQHTFLDFFKQLNLPVIVVSKHYLGSINHTLLTINSLKSHNISVLGVVFIGNENKATEQIIEKLGNCTILGRIPYLKEVNKTTIRNCTELINLS